MYMVRGQNELFSNLKGILNLGTNSEGIFPANYPLVNEVTHPLVIPHISSLRRPTLFFSPENLTATLPENLAVVLLENICPRFAEKYHSSHSLSVFEGSSPLPLFPTSWAVTSSSNDFHHQH